MIVTPDLLKLDKGLDVHYLLGVRGWKYSIRDNDFFCEGKHTEQQSFFQNIYTGQGLF